MESEETQLCAGCGDKIYDRYYLSAIDKLWHQDCLRCSSCQRVLDGETSCFFREGEIYCRNDYYRKFQQHICTRCRFPIESTDLVMRARDLVFHVSCFVCNYCNMPLEPGQEYGSIMNAVYCRVHFVMMDISNQSGLGSPRDSMLAPGPQTTTPVSMASPDGMSKFNDYYTNGSAGSLFEVGSGLTGGPQDSLFGTTVPPYDNSTVNSGVSVAPPGVMGAGRGRPRKRKSSTDLAGQPVPPESVALSSLFDSYGYGKLYNILLQGYPIGNVDINCLSPSGVGYQQINGGRQKRIRTSFKTTQLRVMKTYFGHNHNPDAKDLKTLASRTGLSKRVLQVWFQNARAKLRRSENKTNTKNKDKEVGTSRKTSSNENPNENDESEDSSGEKISKCSTPKSEAANEPVASPTIHDMENTKTTKTPEHNDQSTISKDYSIKQIPESQPFTLGHFPHGALPLAESEYTNNIMLQELVSKEKHPPTTGVYDIGVEQTAALFNHLPPQLFNAAGPMANNFNFVVPPGPGGPEATPADPTSYFCQENVV